MSARAALTLRPGAHDAPPLATAMVLAAGLGKRMRPLTATRPKPLVEVAGKPLLDHVFDRLRAAGIGRAVVNTHYLADALEAHLRHRVQGIEVIVSDERDRLLETGGGVANALPLIPDERFLIANSDNLWIDGPVDAIRLLGSRWDDSIMDALLLVVPLARANCHGGIGDFHMDANGQLTRRRPGRVAPFVFTGVQIVSRRLFEDAPEGAYSFNLLWDRAIANGRLYGFVHQGLWFDVGWPGAIAEAEALLAQG
ncbi:nucleotidyltransferase family protein [Sphingomonas nostoxanthinifaciens]|uniref:nucleotidyltransferase family protein n=1 Tax=Sphingomonas nostoxanthinifaciens TaxID=2872652 RepID=UPI001CC21BE1|nr:nucleotidyltransferase family protein [Sphingomonas nostoxanthinifaciens]UAK25377.1 nucleotidyltransferase family protein [Sphingomonas nostoxanthinifaciens]